MKKKAAIYILIFFSLFNANTFAQQKDSIVNYKPYVNQAGYNTGESKRFVCYGSPDGTPFKIINASSQQVVFTGKILNNQGWFTEFNPLHSTDEFVIEVNGHGQSVPFWIADHLLEKTSSKLAYDFFVDVRGNSDLSRYNMARIYGGGPSRDGGAYGLESVFEILQYSANPALYDNWKDELGEKKVADLIDLIIWHAEFAAKYFDTNLMLT